MEVHHPVPIEIHRKWIAAGNGWRERSTYTCTFIVSSWAPSLRKQSERPLPDGMTSLITYGQANRPDASTAKSERIPGTVDVAEADIQRVVDNSGTYSGISMYSESIVSAWLWV